MVTKIRGLSKVFVDSLIQMILFHRVYLPSTFTENRHEFELLAASVAVHSTIEVPNSNLLRDVLLQSRLGPNPELSWAFGFSKFTFEATFLPISVVTY